MTESVVPGSVAFAGNIVLSMMKKMGWEPGQALGKTNRGTIIPSKGWLVERGKREGLGFRELKQRKDQVIYQLVEVLKLKIEQELELRRISSVFEEEAEQSKHQ